MQIEAHLVVASSNADKAYRAAKKILFEHLDPTKGWDVLKVGVNRNATDKSLYNIRFIINSEQMMHSDE